MINNPNYYHLTELFDILETFETQKEETANEKTCSYHGNHMQI